MLSRIERLQAKADRAGNVGEKRTYSIGELSAEFGLTPRSVRFYEDQGLIQPARDGMTRVYSRRDRARLKLICRGKRLGFSLAEIRDFLKLYDVDDRQIEQMRFALVRGRERIRALERQYEDVRQTLGELRDIEAAVLTHLREVGAAPEDEAD